MSAIKEEAHRLVDQLPDGASWDDLVYQIYVRQKIETGRKAVSEGRVVSQEDAEQRLSRWRDR
jgi:hypothetical protein